MEEWKEVKGFEDVYLISNMGNVKNISRNRLLKPQKNNNGYLFVYLKKDGVSRKSYMHRLVAEAFLDNSQNLPIINHKDENRQNNKVDNLEWCDYKYNTHYGNCIEKLKEKAIKHKVVQITSDGREIEYNSLREVERLKGYPHGNIAKCCKGIYKSAYGSTWRYAT